MKKQVHQLDQKANQPPLEQEGHSLPYHQQVDELINKIVDQENTYYYCQCKKIRRLNYHDTVIIFTEKANKKSIIISHYVLEKERLKRSIEDYKLVKLVKDGFDLPAIADIIYKSDPKVQIKFKSPQTTWELQFPNIREKKIWIRLLNKKQYELINRQILFNKQEYSKTPEINDLLRFQLESFKAVLMENLECDEYARKTSAFMASFQELGKRLEVICKQSQGKVENYKEKMGELQSKDESVQRKMEELQKNSNELEETNKQLTDKIKIMEQQKIAELEQHRKSIEQLKSQSTLSQNSMQERIAQIQEECTLKIQEIRATQETVTRSLQVQIEQLDNKNKKLVAKNKQLEAKCEFYAQQISSLNSSINSSKELSFTLDSELKSLTKKYEENQSQNFFQGDILYNFQFHKDFLKQSIQNYTKNTIADTRLIFKYDRHNKTNFHVYIDNLPNIVIVIRTANGSYIAGYTQDPFSPAVNPFPKNRGLIIGLTTQKFFPVLQGRRAITYDEYYIIFGNSQIRLKSQQQKVFSNFAISNGYYATNNCKIDGLLGQSNREVGIEGYDIYQLYFKA